MSFDTSRLSVQTKADIYHAWSLGMAPTQVARTLRLALSTVIAEYVRLDSTT